VAGLLLEFRQRKAYIAQPERRYSLHCLYVPVLRRTGRQDQRRYSSALPSACGYDHQGASRRCGADNTLELPFTDDGLESCPCSGCRMHHCPQASRADPLHSSHASLALQTGWTTCWCTQHRDWFWRDRILCLHPQRHQQGLFHRVNGSRLYHNANCSQAQPQASYSGTRRKVSQHHLWRC